MSTEKQIAPGIFISSSGQATVVPETVMALKAKGVEFMSDPVSAPDAKHVVCAKGPDGILIEFVQLPD